MQITFQQLKAIAPFAPKGADAFVPYLNQVMAKYGIDTLPRVAMFLAQLAHESSSFRYTKEIADGRAYEGRKDLGNTHDGDGVKYKGRGLIQITGRFNYATLGKELGADLLTNPQLLETPSYAVASAGWYWNKNGLNKLADAKNVQAVTKRINGGLNGLQAREEFYNRAIKVLSAAA